MKTCATCAHLTEQEGRYFCACCRNASEHTTSRAEWRARLFMLLLAAAIIAALLWAGYADYHDMLQGRM